MPEPGLVIVDKPAGMTSHDVVARVRRLAGTRRVGHAGTLDPMATGVLVVGVEQATRLLGHLMLTAKEYHATIRLGQSTTTDDAEGEPIDGASATAVTDQELQAGIKHLTGEIMQVPPGVSAIKVNGERAYKLTRAGAAPELKPRQVSVHDFTVTQVRAEGDYLDVDAVIGCSSGTYIRALARDLGAGLGTGGHLTALRRTRVGAYDIGQAQTLDQLSERFVPISLRTAAAAAFQVVGLTWQQARRLAHGGQLPLRELAQGGEPAPGFEAVRGLTADALAAVPPAEALAAFAPDGTLVALVTPQSDRLRSLAVFTTPDELSGGLGQ
ncbi:MAG TPA: tRNA pseudouridine(55) synthase TruB [Trebonia sp.]|nr:tRNA pseudouridine(55) synthase TruB [Trebonia sp.]